MLNQKVTFKFGTTTNVKKDFPDKPKADIVSLYEKLVGGVMKRTGKVFLVPCCFHDDSKPSLAIYPDTSSYFCFACNKSGDAFSFVENVLHCDFKEALKFIKENQ